MTAIGHPSLLLPPEWVATIRTASLMAESKGMLTEEVVQLIYENNWFNLLVPKIYGGLELSLPEAVAWEEALAWADGSLGWVVTLCAGAGWFGGFLNAGFAKEIFSDEHCCLAGSGMISGTADKTNGGYIINGTWQYASGTPWATAFTANCRVADGSYLSFVFLRKEVTIINTWNAMGMAATASHSFKITDLFVPDERAFEINTYSFTVNEPLYRYPFLQLAEATLAANVSGMAMHFMDSCEGIFTTKHLKGKPLMEQDIVKKTFDRNQTDILTAREQLFTAVQRSWDEGVADAMGNDALHEMSRAVHRMVEIARRCVYELYPYCGLSAMDKSTDINRCWRDMQTALQHPLLVFGN